MSHVPHCYSHARALLARSHANAALQKVCYVFFLCAETEMAPNP